MNFICWNHSYFWVDVYTAQCGNIWKYSWLLGSWKQYSFGNMGLLTLLRRKTSSWSSAPFSTQTSAVLFKHTWCSCENLVVYDNLEILIMRKISILPTFLTTLDSKSDFAFWKEQLFLFMLQKIFQTPHILLCLSNALHHRTLLKGVQILH